MNVATSAKIRKGKNQNVASEIIEFKDTLLQL